MRKVNRILSDNYDGRPLSTESNIRKIVRGSDGLINFGGALGFDEENRITQKFTIALTNKADEEKRIVLFPGATASLKEIEEVAGFKADAIAVDGDVIINTDKQAEVTCVAKKLAYFQRFLCKNPTRVMKILLTTKQEDQFSRDMTSTKLSPYRRLESTSFNGDEYRSPSDSNTLMAKIDVDNLQLDDQTVLDIVLAPQASVNITFFMGASRNDAYTLSEQAKIALG